MRTYSRPTTAVMWLAVALAAAVCTASDDAVATDKDADADFVAPHPELLDAEGSFAAPGAPGAAFYETFQSPTWSSRWAKASDAKYEGELAVGTAESAPVGNIHDKGARIPVEAQHYGYVAQLDSAVGNDKEGKVFVFQYELKAETSLSCAGAYFKLMRADAAVNGENLNGDSPYTIMFGPDKCGSTNKVHFILQVKSPLTGEYAEHHFEKSAYVKTDKLTHLYTLIIDSDSNDFEIRIDGQVAKTGNLLSETDMKPPVNPPKFIDDPNDSKPEDWVENAKMDDPEVSKPEDWDEEAPFEIVDENDSMPEGWLADEPEVVVDPEAVKPEDWDDEEDGVWVAASIANPKCEETPGCGPWSPRKIRNPEFKGKWHAPQVDNPDYIGEWAPAQIDNPDYYEIAHPAHFAPIGAVGLEIWTMNSGLLFDNIYMGSSVEGAEAFANATFTPKSANEEAVAEAQRKAEAAARASASDTWVHQALKYFDAVVDFAKAEPLMAGGAAAAGLVPLVLFCLCTGGSSKTGVVTAATAAHKKDDDVSDGEGEDEHEDGEVESEEEQESEEDTSSGVRQRKNANKKN